MLLRSNTESAHALASANFERFPDNAVFAATHAFALYQQRKFAEAHEIMWRIPELKLQHPGFAGYYGLVLEAAGHPARARTYLDVALGSDLLLPSERQMMKSVRDGIP